MLQCTAAAAATLDQVREEQGLPETCGLRVFPADAGDGQVSLGLGFAEEPQDGDQVAETHGTKLFVAPEIADQLSGMALDIEPDPSQDGRGEPQIVLKPVNG
jgi:iron-sulfur cluster assembly protein